MMSAVKPEPGPLALVAIDGDGMTVEWSPQRRVVWILTVSITSRDSL